MVDRKGKEIKSIELFDREIEVINRVNILNQQGFKEEDMYIITSEDNEVSVLMGLTDIVIKEEDDSIWDKFKSFLKGEDSVTDAFNRLGLDEDEKDYYKEKVDDGKYLLYVDKEHGSFKSLNDDFQPITPDLREERRKRRRVKKDEAIPDSIKRDVGMEDGKIGTKGDDLPHDIPQAVDHPDPTRQERS